MNVRKKLTMSYMPMVVGCERPLNIVDDEDLFVYLRSELVDKLSIVCKTYVGMNYKQLEPLED